VAFIQIVVLSHIQLMVIIHTKAIAIHSLLAKVEYTVSFTKVAAAVVDHKDYNHNLIIIAVISFNLANCIISMDIAAMAAIADIRLMWDW
jgi:hypothetical protein